MTIETIHSDQAPAAIGPYSQATKAGNLIFCSGQIPINPTTGEVVSGDARIQTHQVMKNLQAVLVAANSNLSQVVKCTIYLKDISDFEQVNEIYGSYFSPPFPARVTIQAANLPKNVDVEIDVIANVL